jgi:hypothetical protein
LQDQNAQPTIGSGTIYTGRILLPNKEKKPKIRIQPFGAVTYKNFDALRSQAHSLMLDLTFLRWASCKITTQYSTRPVYTASTNRSGSLGDFVVQLQIYL